jgi:hypothetical protein
VTRVLPILVVAALLALPILSARGQAASERELDREATAYAICSDHGGVHATTSRLITCWDGALHRWDGSHVRRRVPVR